MPKSLDDKERAALTARRILKVNHAGEYGAIRIYRAQIAMARAFYPALLPFLEDTLSHEIRHCELFRAAMPARRARPCRIMALWGNGGYLLGFVTALFGRKGVWVCTAAVESAVHHHMDDQLHFLEERDPELHELILGIQVEELSHLRHAEDHLTQEGAFTRLARRLIFGTTDVVIWLSTWGDSTRMTKELRASRSN